MKKIQAFLKDKYKLISVLAVAAVLILAWVWVGIASNNGVINSVDRYAWNENVGWINFGSGGSTVRVLDSELTGYAWAENVGWISLNCSNDNSCSSVDYKVSNDGEGNLSGYAYGENIGWINFKPENGGVTIDSNGEFSGYAWGENIGWIIFNCETTSSCSEVSFKLGTDWRPQSVWEQSEALEISDVEYSSTASAIVIEWETNRKADGHIRYGKDKNLKKEEDEDKEEKKHKVTLRDLDSGTKYYFRVKSTDKNGLSDSSKIYSISTKVSPSALVSFPLNYFRDKFGEAEDLEEVEISVSDEREEEESQAEEAREEPAVGQEGEAETVDEREGESKLWRFLGLLGSAKDVVFGFFSDAFTGAGKLARTGYDALLAGQKKIAEVFSKFRGKQAREIRGAGGRIIERFFTTEVFSEGNIKRIAEVKFQILDRKYNPLAGVEATLASDPQTSVTDDDGIASFRNVAVGDHTLAFTHQGEEFKKKVAISDTLTDEGKVRAEIVQIKAEKEKIALWMWLVTMLMIVSLVAAVYFGWKYYKLKRNKA